MSLYDCNAVIDRVHPMCSGDVMQLLRGHESLDEACSISGRGYETI